MNLGQNYLGKNVLLIGGLGFIGSNLARLLVSLGANITIITRSLEKLSNISDIRNKIRVLEFSEDVLLEEIFGKNLIFDLAESVDRNSSESENVSRFVVNREKLIEGCKKYNPSVRIVYTSSRLVYGLVEPEKSPINEKSELNPFNVYGHIKKESEKLYQESGLDFVIARIGIVYGEKNKIVSPSDGLMNWFIKRALEDNDLLVREKSNRIRDFIYLADLIDALTISGICENAGKEVFNFGSGEPVALISLATKIIMKVGRGSIKIEKNSDAFDFEDSFYLDIDKARKVLNWKPKIFIDEGISKMVNFYKGTGEKFYK